MSSGLEMSDTGKISSGTPGGSTTEQGTKRSLDSEDSSGPSSKKSRSELAGLPTRQYLDQTVVPILLQGLSSLARERPKDPIEYLATYLIRHKKEYETDHS
eukprot:TRINITY_DN32930_c0_g1_i1.p1 TRINITY_DN32930_c0_g1~~TRINITY_DN32930_c0_g1_i1.p1  ORF type:complete len:101 (+),score=15.66 TRINITY_DN32930_c0_g1_i1:37-339(+)